MSKKYKIVETDEIDEEDLIDDEEEEQPVKTNSGLLITLICVLLIAITMLTLAGIIYFKEKAAVPEEVPETDPEIIIENDTDLTLEYKIVDNICLCTLTVPASGGYSMYVYVVEDDDLSIRVPFTLVFKESLTRECEFVANNNTKYLIRIKKHA